MALLGYATCWAYQTMAVEWGTDPLVISQQGYTWEVMAPFSSGKKNDSGNLKLVMFHSYLKLPKGNWSFARDDYGFFPETLKLVHMPHYVSKCITMSPYDAGYIISHNIPPPCSTQKQGFNSVAFILSILHISFRYSHRDPVMIVIWQWY